MQQFVDVTLTREELVRATLVGRARQNRHPLSDRRSERLRQDEYTEHIAGVIGEFAFAKLIDANFEETLTEVIEFAQRGGDGGMDFEFPGLAVDVKTRLPREDGEEPDMLVWAHGLREDVIYVHGVMLQPGVVQFRGWMRGERVRLQRQDRLRFNRWTHIVIPKKLRPMSELLEMISQAAPAPDASSAVPSPECPSVGAQAPGPDDPRRSCSPADPAHSSALPGAGGSSLPRSPVGRTR